MNGVSVNNLISTKPHMIKLRNQEYIAHQKNLMKLMGGTGGFADLPHEEPMIRRKEKYLMFDKEQYRRLEVTIQARRSNRRTRSSWTRSSRYRLLKLTSNER